MPGAAADSNPGVRLLTLDRTFLFSVPGLTFDRRERFFFFGMDYTNIRYVTAT